MKSKRRGMIIDCHTFRVVPDPVLDMWRDGKLHDSSVKVWLLMQRAAYDFKGEINFTTLQRYCKVGSATLSRALKQLIELGLVQKTAQVYSVVFNKPNATADTSTMEVGTSTVKATTSMMEVGTSTVKATTSMMEVPTSTVKAATSTVKADLSSNSPGELRIHIDTEGDSRETPPVRCAASPVSVSTTTNGAQAADSHIHISSEDLALLAQRYGIRFARPPASPAAAIAIRELLYGDGSHNEYALAVIEAIRARCGNGDFGGADAPAPREATHTTGG